MWTFFKTSTTSDSLLWRRSLTQLQTDAPVKVEFKVLNGTYTTVRMEEQILQ